MPWIGETLQQVADRLDKNKCAAEVRPLDHGYALDVRTFSSDCCPFHIEVTPQLFDIFVAERFSASDVYHEWSDFEGLALAIASGRVTIGEKRGLVFRRSLLEVRISDDDIFYMSGNLRLRSAGEPPVYSSYVLPGISD